MVELATTQPSGNPTYFDPRNPTSASTITWAGPHPGPHKPTPLQLPTPPQEQGSEPEQHPCPAFPGSSLRRDQALSSLVVRTYWQLIRDVTSDVLTYMMQHYATLAAVLALIWVPVMASYLVASHNSWAHPGTPSSSDTAGFLPQETSGHSMPPSPLSRSFSTDSSSIQTDRLDFAHLVHKQGSMFETFSDVMSRLNAPVVLDLNNNNNNNNPPDQGKTDGNSADRQVDLAADDPYGLVARVAASRSNLPMHMTMKLARLAIIDLKVAVKYSRLGEESKNLLVEHLDIFHSTAKVHSRKLQFLEARSKGCIDGQVVRNVFLSAELDRLAKMIPEGRVGVWGRIRNAFSFGRKQDVEVASTKTKLRQLYAKTFKEGQKQLRTLVLQVQDLQQGLDDMDQTRWTIIDIMGRERGEQERLQDESLAEVWGKVGKTHFEQETYSNNQALLKSMEKQQQLTGGDLEWIRGKLTGFEGEMEVLWERMVEARVVEAEKDTGREGSGFERTAKGAAGVSTPLSDHLTGDQGQTSYSFQDEIRQIQSEIDKLKAKQASRK